MISYITALNEARFPNKTPASSVCPICEMQIGDIKKADYYTIPCYRCGTFKITPSAIPRTANISPQQRVLLSGFCRDSLQTGALAVINTDTLRESVDWPMPRLGDRAKRMLMWAALERDVRPDSRDAFSPSSDVLLGSSYSIDTNDTLRLARILHEWGYAAPPTAPTGDIGAARYGSTSWTITAKGRLFVEEEIASKISSTGFAAMWFDPSMLQIFRDGISPAIVDAGFDPVRVDQVEHLGKIDDEIMLQIQRSRFVVADFTGHRSGVYFEAGYALGLGIPVIWTCRQNELAHLHFDIRQYNCIGWNDGTDLRRRLAFRIEQTVGLGPRKR